MTTQTRTLYESHRSAFLRPRARVPVLAGRRKRSADDALTTAVNVIPAGHYGLTTADDHVMPSEGVLQLQGSSCPSTPNTWMRNLSISTTSPSAAAANWKTPSPVARQVKVPLKVLSSSTPVKKSAGHLTAGEKFQQQQQKQQQRSSTLDGLPPRTPISRQTFSSIRSTTSLVPISNDEVVVVSVGKHFKNYAPNNIHLEEDVDVSPCSTKSSTSASWCSLMRLETSRSAPSPRTSSPPLAALQRYHPNNTSNLNTSLNFFPRISARVPVVPSAQSTPARRAKLTPKSKNRGARLLKHATPQRSNCTNTNTTTTTHHEYTATLSNLSPPRAARGEIHDGGVNGKSNDRSSLLKNVNQYNLSISNLQNSASVVGTLILDDTATMNGSDDCEFNSDGFPNANVNVLVHQETRRNHRNRDAADGDEHNEHAKNEDFFLSTPRMNMPASSSFQRQHHNDDAVVRMKEAKQAKKCKSHWNSTAMISSEKITTGVVGPTNTSSNYFQESKYLHPAVLGEAGQYLTSLNDVNGNVATFGRSASATSSLTCATFSSNSLSEFFITAGRSEKL